FTSCCWTEGISVHMVQMDAFCSDLSLRSAPVDLPRGVQTLDLSRNHVQNLTRETLAFHTGLRRLNLRSNEIHFIQPGLFVDMADLKVLDLSRNRLNVLALSNVSLGPLTAVETLDLSSNGLYTGMTDYFLAHSPSLEVLALNGNSITKIAQNTFSGSPRLKKIAGAFDSLSGLTNSICPKNSITLLNLSKNSVELFHSATSTDYYRLLSLDLSENKMSSFPLLPRNNRLERLDVSRNQLQSVNDTATPDEKTFFSHLRYLDMSYNQLQSLPESFFHCMRSLEVLNVSNNCIGEFSVADEGLLRTVKVINLGYNSLRSLTFGENTLRSLEKLLLRGNGLATLDSGVFRRLPSIEHLQLRQNNLQICSWGRNRQDAPGCVSFSSVPTLQILDLSDNQLRTVPADAFAGSPLKSLDLSLNPGLDMDRDSLSGLERSLVHLLLRENNISSLSMDLSSLTSLKHIDLSTNQLTTVPAWNRDSSIESLNLQNNHLVTLEYSTMLALEPSLKTLYMGSNPLSCCSNLDLLQMVQNSAVVVPDIETATCVHQEYSEPVNIEQVTQDMCLRPGGRYYAVAAVVVALVTVVTLVLLVRSLKLIHFKRISCSIFS
uniref:Leucine rich repeat containing 32 n=1 Tax=Gasterosteus aculeatus aculeatus TaxID=481459 RepID=G3QCF7_GASAC